MPFIETDFPGLMIFEPRVFEDSRGYFFESYNEQVCDAAGVDIRFVQDNQAKSSYGVVRGLHYQLAPHAQTKFIRVLSGAIIDAVVDLRKASPGFGKTFAIELSAENKRQLLVPKGFAHGYSVISDTCEVFYKCDTFYNKESEAGILFNDPALAIPWRVPEERQVLSEKDTEYPTFENSHHNFDFSR